MDADLYKAAIEGDICGIEKLSEKIGQVTEEDGRTILHLASERGKIECVRFILTQFPNEELLIKTDRKGRTALHYAAERGHIDAVELLIRAARGLLPSSEFEKFIRHADVLRDTALHRAVYEYKVEAVKLLVKADPNHKHSVNEWSQCPLYIAVNKGYNDIVKVILESCKTPNFDSPNGKSALHAAVRNCEDTVELLINAARGFLPSSEFEKFIRHADCNGDTALHHAVDKNQVETVKLLVNADPNHKHSLNNRFESPLYIAALEGYKDIVRVICESCATPSFDGPYGQTALHAAIGSPNTVEILINAARGLLPSSEFEKFIRQADRYGDTALQHAVYKNKVEAVKLLVKADPNQKLPVKIRWAVEQGFKDIVNVICGTPNFDGLNGKSGLQAAIENGDTEFDAVELINVTRGLFPSSEFEKFIRHADDNGDTALHMAVERNQVELVKLLLEVDPTHEYSKGPSGTLHYIAVKQGYKDMIELIFRSCTSTFDGPQGQTSLHVAVENGDKDSVRVILDRREELVLIRDDRGWTAADYAASRNFLSILDLLIKTENSQFHDYSEYKLLGISQLNKNLMMYRLVNCW